MFEELDVGASHEQATRRSSAPTRRALGGGLWTAPPRSDQRPVHGGSFWPEELDVGASPPTEQGAAARAGQPRRRTWIFHPVLDPDRRL